MSIDVMEDLQVSNKARAPIRACPYWSPGYMGALALYVHVMFTSCTPHVHTSKAATCFLQMFSLNNIKLHGSPGRIGALAI